MKAYSYNDAGIFVRECECQKNPVRPGEFLVPGHATLTPPPKFDPEKKLARWNGKKWVVEDKPVPPEPEPMPDPEPSDMERLEAQVTYTAMMTDTLLSEV